MPAIEGDLLIGGERLKNVHIELDSVSPDGDSLDWEFAGHLHLTPAQCAHLACHRTYRLELPDGRGGQIELSQIELEQGQLLVNFQPAEGVLQSH